MQEMQHGCAWGGGRQEDIQDDIQDDLYSGRQSVLEPVGWGLERGLQKRHERAGDLFNSLKRRACHDILTLTYDNVIGKLSNSR